MNDPIFRVLEQLGTKALRAEAIANAWATSTAPHAMVRLLAAAGSDECDAAARAGLEAAADVLRAMRGRSGAIDRLLAGAKRPTVCGELSKLLNVTWVPEVSLRGPRDEHEAKVAARVRDVVKRPPTLADFQPPPRRAPVPTGAEHLADAIAGARPLDHVPGIRVISPESHRRVGPELGGLVCERIFGPWWPRGAITEDDRTERWGHIELAQPCVHPVIAGAKLAVLPVVPPHFRRWTTVNVDDLRRYAKEERARLEAAESRGELCDPPDKILAEAGLEDPDAIDGPGLREHPLNTVYRAFINLGDRNRRLLEVGAPNELIMQSAAELDRWSRKLAAAWLEWLGELPADTNRAWALRALAAS